jgi:hypothetical protein
MQLDKRLALEARSQLGRLHVAGRLHRKELRAWRTANGRGSVGASAEQRRAGMIGRRARRQRH